MSVMKPSGGTACCWGVAGDSVRWRTQSEGEEFDLYAGNILFRDLVFDPEE